jgi:AraC family transcriptional regulator
MGGRMTSVFHSRLVASGSRWRISDEVCRAGPSDRPFEEQHSRFSVSAVLAGTFVYRGSPGRALMSSGSLLLGQQGAQFSCSHEHGCGDRCIAFYFDESWIEDLARELPAVRSTRISQVRIPPAQSLAPLIADIQTFVSGTDLVDSEELALRMAAVALTSGNGPASQAATPAEERRISAVLRNLDEKISEPLSLARLSGAAGMGRYHFLRAFQRVTGQTPWRFILSQRLALAARNLTTESGTVLDAALASGFGDLSEFTRRFQRHFGVTPGVYRRRKSRYSTRK